MHEILSQMSAGRVLDLGSRGGSFDPRRRGFWTVRVDLDIPAGAENADRVRADAARLPFRDGCFQAIIANHSLEHFDRLDEALAEIGRTAAGGAALYVSVPDVRTISDRIYRWLGRGGGHVNGFDSAAVLAKRIESRTGLRHTATRVLYTSLSFLNAKNFTAPPPRRMLLLGGGSERAVFLLNYLLRKIGRLGWQRADVYGWALYFGQIGAPVSETAWRNVCLRCGSGHPSAALESERAVRRRFGVLVVYRCPGCGAANPYTPD
jgi:SAM-dependent methyltransferase